MHSRIFQISKKPVEDRISEDRYYDGFVGRIADYVDELDTDGQLESIRWLAETPGIRVNNIGDATATITIVDKKAYFAGSWKTRRIPKCSEGAGKDQPGKFHRE